MRSRTLWFTVGALTGSAAGFVAAQRHLRRHRADLFSPQLVERFAALGYLAGRRDAGTVRLLRDYLAWESQPLLRRRAEVVVRRMEAALG
jgi:hypothetical protein